MDKAKVAEILCCKTNWNNLELPEQNIYFKDDDTVIYCADCKDILPLLPNVDLVLTDPPYNVGLDYSDGDNKVDYQEWCKHWFSLLSEPIFITPGMVNIAMWYSIKTPLWCISWIKNNQCSPSRLGGFNAWEPILVYGKPNKRIGQDILINSIITSQQGVGDHPCPKDAESWSMLIDKISNKNDIVLDTFLGSGTTAYCAKKLGRKCIGIEISEKYCQIAVERLRQSVMRLE